MKPVINIIALYCHNSNFYVLNVLFKVVHGDLAAKNILLTKNNLVKICDFGLARTMYANENYRNFEIFPVKWMAIESIRDGRFSLQSDIWSFAVVLWELFSLSNIPYHGILSEDLAEKLSNGYRMDKPKYAIDEVSVKIERVILK